MGSVVPASLDAKLNFSQDRWSDAVNYVSNTMPVTDGTSERTMGWSIVVRQPAEETFHNRQGIANTLLQRKNALAKSNAMLEQTVADRTAELVRSNEELHRLSRHDALTGVFNRLAAKERLHAEFARMKRAQTPYAVLMMDIDYFKRVNDTYGHDTGNKVLQSMARAVAKNSRETDFLARFKGEEFLVLLPKTRLAAASEDDAVHRADGFLYRAKNAGRNRVAATELA